MSVLQRIAEIEKEIDRTQKNKATNYHVGLLKAKMAKLRGELLSEASAKSGGAGEGFEVSKTGDARVGFIGFPSVGKSTLLNTLTGQSSAVAAYEFTTLTCVPGILHHRGARIQLLDLPGIIEGAKDGKGRGKQVIATALSCSLILIVLDAGKPLTELRKIHKELEGFGIRPNKQRPDISFNKTDKGGISITISQGVDLTDLDTETIQSVCREYKVLNCTLHFRCDASVDDLIDVIEGNRKYVPVLYVLNKVDSVSAGELDILTRMPHTVPVSAEQGWNMGGLAEKMWQYLDLVRIYTKPKGQIPDYTSPVVLSSKASTIEGFCRKIHKHLLAEFKFAVVWGRSVKYQPQRVGKGHKLLDEDVVQIVKKLG